MPSLSLPIADFRIPFRPRTSDFRFLHFMQCFSISAFQHFSISLTADLAVDAGHSFGYLFP